MLRLWVRAVLTPNAAALVAALPFLILHDLSGRALDALLGAEDL